MKSPIYTRILTAPPNDAQKRARGEEIISAADFIETVAYYFFIGYLQAWPGAYPSLMHMFTSHSWFTAPIVFSRYHISLMPNRRDFNLLQEKLKKAFTIVSSFLPEYLKN